MSSISAGTTTTTGYVVSSDTTGALVLKTGASGTTALTIDTSQNVGIGTSSVTAGSKVTIAGGNINLTQSDSRFIGGDTVGRSIFSNSDVTTYAIAYGSSHATSAGQFVIASGAGNTMVFNSSGNIGLGVTPSAWNTAGGTRAFEFQNNSGSGSVAGWFGSVNMLNNAIFSATGGGTMRYVATSTATQYQQNNGQHSWLTAPSGTAGNAITFTQAMTLDASGNLLVGATSAAGNSKGYFFANADTSHTVRITNASAGSSAYANLVVSNNAGNVVELGMQSSTRSTTYPANEAWMYTSNGINIGYAGDVKFYTGGIERARITSGGNFGIGTASPAYKFVVQDSAGETLSSIKNTSTNGKDYTLISGGAAGSFAGGRFGLYSITDATELLAATSNTGSTAGGTTGKGVGFAHAGFWIDRGWNDYPSMTVCNTNFVGNTNQSQIRMHGTNATWASYPSAAGSDFACSFFIDGTYQTSSDRRFKTNITNIENALDKVMVMTGKRYQTINRIGEVETAASQNGYKYGFIAQELQAAGLDELYKHYADEDDLTEGYNKAYSVEYDAVVPLLVNAIKEQQALIESLTQRIAALEGTS
jgi:hypothetical protein